VNRVRNKGESDTMMRKVRELEEEMALLRKQLAQKDLELAVMNAALAAKEEALERNYALVEQLATAPRRIVNHYHFYNQKGPVPLNAQFISDMLETDDAQDD